MSNEEKSPEGEKNKKIEALEKMFGPKESKKNPVEDTIKDKFSDALKSKMLSEKPAEPEKEVKEVKTAPLPEVQEETAEKKDIKVEPPKTFPLEKLKENLNPEMKETLKKISNTVPKESINKLINTMENNKEIVFDKGATNVFADLDAVEAKVLSKKLDEWNVPQEASEVNAAVIMAWMNKTKK